MATSIVCMSCAHSWEYIHIIQYMTMYIIVLHVVYVYGITIIDYDRCDVSRM